MCKLVVTFFSVDIYGHQISKIFFLLFLISLHDSLSNHDLLSQYVDCFSLLSFDVAALIKQNLSFMLRIMLLVLQDS